MFGVELARAIARTIVHAEHLARGANAEVSRDDTSGRQPRNASAVLIRPAIAVVVDAVAADFRILVRPSREFANVGVTRSVRETPHLADRTGAGDEGVAADDVAQRTDAGTANPVFVGLAVAVVVHAVAGLGRTSAIRRTGAMAGLVAVPAERAVNERVADRAALAAEALSGIAVGVRGTLVPREVGGAPAAAAEARGAEHRTHAHQDPVHPVLHVLPFHLPLPPHCAAEPHAADPPPKTELPMSIPYLVYGTANSSARMREGEITKIPNCQRTAVLDPSPLFYNKKEGFYPPPSRSKTAHYNLT